MTAMWKIIITIFLLSVIGKYRRFLFFVRDWYEKEELANSEGTLRECLNSTRVVPTTKALI